MPNKAPGDSPEPFICDLMVSCKFHARLRFFSRFFQALANSLPDNNLQLALFRRESIGEWALGVTMRILKIHAGEKAILQSLTTCHLTTYAR